MFRITAAGIGPQVLVAERRGWGREEGSRSPKSKGGGSWVPASGGDEGEGGEGHSCPGGVSEW